METPPDQIELEGTESLQKAEAEARAAQIFAEMLGVVCHRDFYKLGEQMVIFCSLVRLKFRYS